MGNDLISLSMLDELDSNTVGQDVLRYISLPNLLGHEKDTLLYFLGRTLARQIQLDKIEDIYYLFNKFRWGKLELVRDRKNHLTFHLMADEIVKRLQAPINIDFRLEAGFIAEAVQNINGRPAECTESLNERLFRVQFKLFYTD